MRDRVFPAFADPFGTRARELLARAASATLDLDELTARLERAGRTRFGRTKAHAVQQSAADSLGLAALAPAAHREIQALLAQIRLREAHVAPVDAAIAPLREHRGQSRTAIPGVGTVLAAPILAEIGAVGRFPSFRALGAYAGLAPCVFASGQFQGKRQPLSKRGSLSLRRALSLATHSAPLRTPDVDASLRHQLAAGKPDKAALVATARELLARISVVLTEGRPVEVCEAPHDHHLSIAGLLRWAPVRHHRRRGLNRDRRP